MNTHKDFHPPFSFSLKKISFLFFHFFFSNIIHLASHWCWSLRLWRFPPTTYKPSPLAHSIILPHLNTQGCYENSSHESILAGIFLKSWTAARLCWKYCQEEPDNIVHRTQLACLFCCWHGCKALSHCVITIYLTLPLQHLLHLLNLCESKRQTANQKSPSWDESESVGAEQSIINTVGRSKGSERH